MGCAKRRKRKRRMDSGASERLHVDSDSNSMPELKSVSFKKIVDSDYSDSEIDSDSDMDSDEDIVNSGSGYKIWEWGQLQSMITACCVCKLCGSELELKEDVDVKNGWCSMVGLCCTSSSCSGSTDFRYFSTSPNAVQIIQKDSTLETVSFAVFPGFLDFRHIYPYCVCYCV
jgi:hypothetical protein